jgi:DNA polymerase-3 subunit delta'
MKDIIGHNKILDFFKSSLDNGNLSHAYCLVGPKDVGRMGIIRQVSSQILGISIGELTSHPDFRLVRRQKNDKGNKKKNVTVDQIRESRKFVSKQPYKSDHKILVIQEGEKMNKSAANAFLKTLEEPAEYTTIFLSVLDEGLLPDTIASRSQNIYVRPVAIENIKSYLVDNNYDQDFAEDVSLASMGLQEKAKKWIKDENEFEKIKQESERLNEMVDQPFFKKLNSIKNIHEKSGQTGRGQSQQIFSQWQIVLQLLLMKKTGQIALNQINLSSLTEISYKQIKELLEELKEAKKKLHQNINLKLILEQVLLKIP